MPKMVSRRLRSKVPNIWKKRRPREKKAEEGSLGRSTRLGKKFHGNSQMRRKREAEGESARGEKKNRGRRRRKD